MKNDWGFEVGQTVVFDFVNGKPRSSGVVMGLVGDNMVEVRTKVGRDLILHVVSDNVYHPDSWYYDFATYYPESCTE